jgi:hypothetical protein
MYRKVVEKYERRSLKRSDRIARHKKGISDSLVVFY